MHHAIYRFGLPSLGKLQNQLGDYSLLQLTCQISAYYEIFFPLHGVSSFIGLPLCFYVRAITEKQQGLTLLLLECLNILKQLSNKS